MDTYADNKFGLKGPHTRDGFLRFHRKYKNKRLAERYLAMSLGFKHTWKEVADDIGVRYHTILDWVKAYNQEVSQD